MSITCPKKTIQIQKGKGRSARPIPTARGCREGKGTLDPRALGAGQLKKRRQEESRRGRIVKCLVSKQGKEDHPMAGGRMMSMRLEAVLQCSKCRMPDFTGGNLLEASLL